MIVLNIALKCKKATDFCIFFSIFYAIFQSDRIKNTRSSPRFLISLHEKNDRERIECRCPGRAFSRSSGPGCMPDGTRAELAAGRVHDGTRVAAGNRAWIRNPAARRDGLFPVRRNGRARGFAAAVDAHSAAVGFLSGRACFRWKTGRTQSNIFGSPLYMTRMTELMSCPPRS